MTGALPFPHRFDDSLLRACDIRGIYGQTLKPQDAWAIGYLFALDLLKDDGLKEFPADIAVCQDNRLSSPDLALSLIDGMKAAGAHIKNLGVGPTPLLYFAVSTLALKGGVMITGSHNPPSYNGFKLVIKNRPLQPHDIQRLALLSQQPPDNLQPVLKKGHEESYDAQSSYVERLLEEAGKGCQPQGRPLKVVWDAGNGTAGLILKRVLQRLPGEHVLLFGDSDGSYPHHHPDPSLEKNVYHLREAVLKTKADVGFAFDGDADRLGVLDDKGNLLSGDELLILLGKDLLKTHPHRLFLTDVKASQKVWDVLEPLGAQVVLGRTGHSFIKKAMKDRGALLACELSGHIFFSDRYYGFDDALYAGLRVLGIVARMSKPLSSFRESLPLYHTTEEIRVPCQEDKKFQVVEKIRQNLDRAAFTRIHEEDGLRVWTQKGWWLVRASNTENALTLRCEAKTTEDLKELMEQLQNLLGDAGLQVTF